MYMCIYMYTCSTKHTHTHTHLPTQRVCAVPHRLNASLYALSPPAQLQRSWFRGFSPPFFIINGS